MIFKVYLICRDSNKQGKSPFPLFIPFKQWIVFDSKVSCWCELSWMQGKWEAFESCCVRTSFVILCSWITETWVFKTRWDAHLFSSQLASNCVPMSQTLCHLCITHGTVRRASACILHIHGIFPSFSPEGMLRLTGLEESHHRVSDSSTAFLCNWHCSRSTSTSLQTGVSVLPTVKELVKGLSVTTE